MTLTAEIDFFKQMQGNKLQKANAKELRIANTAAHEAKATFAAINQQIEFQSDDFQSVAEFVA